MKREWQVDPMRPVATEESLGEIMKSHPSLKNDDSVMTTAWMLPITISLMENLLPPESLILQILNPTEQHD